MKPLLRGAFGTSLLALCASAQAGYGTYFHGAGIQSSALGGVAYSVAQDTVPLSTNPALALALGNRWDVGVTLEQADAKIAIRGNLLGPNRDYPSRARNFFIPQGGFSLRLSERWAVGATGFFAGFGSDYPDSPYARFTGETSSAINLGQAGLTTALAFALTPDQHLGFGLNLSAQILEVEGLGAFAQRSESPQHVTNQGKDPALGIGFSLGWHGALTPWLSAGLGYRSKTWTQRHQDYAGLLPQQGKLELPESFGGGLALNPTDSLVLILEAQRVLYSKQTALSNPFQRLAEGEDLGADDGPGFGWRDQSIYELGLAWHLNDRWWLKSGFSMGTRQIPRSQTLFAGLAPSTGQRHVSLGAMHTLRSGWELSLCLAKSLRREIRGRNSIPLIAVGDGDSLPLIAGGGEADVEIRSYTAGFSLGRTW